MATRTLGVALWNYRDHDGRRRRALYGQRFELPQDEEARGERAGVFAPDPEPRVSTDTDTPVSVPKQTAPKSAWVDYAQAIGMDRAQAETLSKAELIAAAKEQAAQQYSNDQGA
ncbi:hypothetical protein PR370_01925 [Mycobacterium marinum]|uniref:hypothetical protein n=1 Tax=Mycobacterium marinum TaxID=1781 RepID=UPI0023595863|nr:hypothetical protein [Mycobacterium marinum]MDC8980502.1 hypothetical protein [Mycobacterium marinum]MDC8998064.1 hypothetical protein [Mycobacterium marinum]MDC9008804.1 hypothetical protein [Mycobacterium marinum]